jgi:filamentous hemagglutinin family protein
MNQNLFRLVFNAARGQVMAVSEVAVGQGKAASGERRGRKVAAVLFALALSPLAWSQIVADPNAVGNLKPQILPTANGVTQVNIQTPSAAGVSRNVYSQFDVNTQGAILNNATGNVQTQLGGWVQGNSNLAGGSARVILNEVNSSNPSQLRGYVEVAGQRAEVIIANPAGISVNGGGFINASGVTLSTGTPLMNGGNLEGYRVQRGTVTVDGTGLDTNAADFTNIIARAVQVNAGIWAKDLKVTSGSNTVNAANTSATAIAGTGSAPTVAVDVAALGGMYAGKITLVGTESGVGVNNNGNIVARGGDLVLQANGTLTNRGLIDAGNIGGTAQSRITATTIDNVGTGAIFGDKLAISATTLNNQAENVNGTVKGATIGARTSLNLGVQTLNNSDMGLDTPGNPSTNTAATPSVNILSLGDINIGGSIDASGQAQGTAASVNNTSATIQAGGNVNINVTSVNNTDAHFASTTQNTTTAVSETIGSAGAGYYVNVTQQVVDGPIVTAALPGTISAGGNLTIQANTVSNANSRMLAGGAVSIPVSVSIDNAGVTATKTTTKTGTAYTLSHDRSCQVLFKGSCLAWGPWYDVWTPSAYSSAVNETVTAGAGSTTNNASTSTPSRPGANVPNSSLFQISTNPSANYVVATNPAFTNYKTWLGSDYITSRISLDPSVTQKRLGDGFYEQRLINEQVAQLTGRRFLGNFTSDDQQYRALMDKGVTFAQDFNLRPGIALTAEQIARLTSDIVWLQQETVNLPDGTKTVALVPHIYLAPRSGDLSPSGGLISGASVNINTADLNNSGTILGRKVVQINADTINNLGGQISGDAVALTATQDINNTGGTITAQDQLTLQAGRDINNTSTTATASTGDSRNGITNTTVDRIAGLYVTGNNGVLLASAGRDINLVASVVKNSGANSQTTLVAQNDINLTTLQTGQINNLERDSGNFRRAISTAETGSSIEGAGNVTLSASNDVNARAATVSAGKTLDVAAGNNIILQAGQTTTNVDQMASASGKDLFFSSSIQTRRQEQSATAQVSSFKGESTQLVANNNLVSVGAKLEATGVDTGTGTLRVEGKNNTLLYEVQNFSQTSVTTQTKTGLGVMFNPLGIDVALEDKTVTDARATNTAMGTKLVSTQKIEIGVGNKTELRGTEVDAPQIAFVKTDPNKRGELILGGSTNTTQTSHTEKTETAGVWQEQKGQGSTTQSLNQTQLEGNVNFDNALKITVQIPDTKGGQDLKTQIQALAGQSRGRGSSSGLEYLNTLAQRTDIQWDKVALAHEKWSYSQAGLTPAGAALLTIAVAAGTGGMGAGLTGTSGALGTAMSAGFSSLASQAAVSMVNNGGDIGKTLEALGKEESIKNLLLTMATAGALDKLNANYFPGVDAKNSFIDQFQKNLTNNIATDLINSALAGKHFDETSLASSLKNALINTGTAQGANAIGEGLVARNLNEFTHKLAHAVLGCAGAEAAGGDCRSGAVGAVVGELTAEYASKSGMSNADALALAKVLAATSGVMTGGGGDNAAAVNTAANAGANAAENNYLKHAEALRRARLEKDLEAGTCGTQCKQDLADLKALDEARNNQLAACQGVNNDTCNTARQEVRSAAADYIRNGQVFNTRGASYAGEYIETTELAYATIDNKRSGALKAVADMASDFVSALVTGYKAKDGDPAAIQQVVASSKAVKEFVSDTSNLPYLLGFMTPGQRQEFAAAVESNDGTKVGKMLTDQTLALVGTISTVGVAAKATSLTATALREAAVAKSAARAAKLEEVAAVAAAKVENGATTDMPGFGKAAVRDFEPGTSHRAENINTGQVTDRDGLPRIDADKRANDAQLAQNLGQDKAPYFGTQRPAWMEGTKVQDKVLVKPETYRMVVNESEYDAIRTAIQRGDSSAAQNLGGWATKEPVTSASDVRGKLAISSEWKGQGGQGMYVIEFTAKPGVGVREGTVGPMFDAKVESTLPGGGHQVQFMDKPPRTNPELYQINLSKSRKLK